MKRAILLAALVVVGGCMLLEQFGKAPAWPYDKVPIEPGAAIPDTPAGINGQKERDKYRCIRGVMWCEAFGVTMSCRCPP